MLTIDAYLPSINNSRHRFGISLVYVLKTTYDQMKVPWTHRERCSVHASTAISAIVSYGGKWLCGPYHYDKGI